MHAPPDTPGRRATDAEARDLRRAYAEALRAGDPATAERIIDDAFDAGFSVAAVHDRIVAPAMRWIGELWQRGEAGVGDEHLATAISQEVLGRMFQRALTAPPRSRQRVLLAAAQGEHHTMGLRMAADLLEGAGFDVLYLGADVPLTALLDTCRSHAPATVGLTVSMALNVPTLISEIEELCALEPPPAIFAAGRALAPAIEQGLDVPEIDGVENVVQVVEALLSAPPRSPVVPAALAARVSAIAETTDIGTEALDSRDAGFSRTALAAAESTRDAARHAFAMEQLAFRDPLTGLWNRRAYDDRFAELSEHDEAAAMVLIVDVDRFKSINDTYGHDAGDRALVGVGDAMLRSVRPGDFVARYGGDEFVILLPGANVADAVGVGHRILASVRRDLTDPAVTVSVGVSEAFESQLRTSLAVDRALYDAKETGRDRVVVA